MAIVTSVMVAMIAAIAKTVKNAHSVTTVKSAQAVPHAKTASSVRNAQCAMSAKTLFALRY